MFATRVGLFPATLLTEEDEDDPPHPPPQSLGSREAVGVQERKQMLLKDGEPFAERLWEGCQRQRPCRKGAQDL